MLKLISQNNVPFILSSFADQQRLTTSLPALDVYINSLKKRLTYCMDKGILNSNIAIDLNLEMFTNKFLLELYTNLNKIKNTFDNVLISSYNLQNVENGEDYSTGRIVEYFINNKINLIRHDSFRHIKEIDQIMSCNSGEDLNHIIKQIKSNTLIERVEDIPRYHYSLDSYQNKRKSDDYIIDESQVKKEDELSNIIKKLEENQKRKLI
jgi:hypothetical protein